VASHFLLGVEICTGKDGSLDYCISVCIVRYDFYACYAKVASRARNRPHYARIENLMHRNRPCSLFIAR